MLRAHGFKEDKRNKGEDSSPAVAEKKLYEMAEIIEQAYIDINNELKVEGEGNE